MKFNKEQKVKLRAVIREEVKKSASSTNDAIRLKMLEACLRADDFDDDPACYSAAKKHGII